MLNRGLQTKDVVVEGTLIFVTRDRRLSNYIQNIGGRSEAKTPTLPYTLLSQSPKSIGVIMWVQGKTELVEEFFMLKGC